MMWMLRAMLWMLRAMMWLLRAMMWMLRAMMRTRVEPHGGRLGLLGGEVEHLAETDKLPKVTESEEVGTRLLVVTYKNELCWTGAFRVRAVNSQGTGGEFTGYGRRLHGYG
eukprot:1665194-Pyramimonas_sp.AAC.1